MCHCFFASAVGKINSPFDFVFTVTTVMINMLVHQVRNAEKSECFKEVKFPFYRKIDGSS